MIARFAVAEQALMAVARRQEMLLLSAESRALDTDVPIDDVIRDVNAAGLAYITEVQVHALHLALALQESPARVATRAQQLTECIAHTTERWSELKNLSDKVKATIASLEESDQKKSWGERGKERFSGQTHDFPALKERREKILENEKTSTNTARSWRPSRSCHRACASSRIRARRSSTGVTRPASTLSSPSS